MNTRISTLLMFAILVSVTLTAAARAAGPLAGWGGNTYGQSNVPPGPFTAVAAGSAHSLAIRSNGMLAGWGYNANGQINVPAGTFTAIAGGRDHSLAIRSDGTLAGWGYNGEGQINVPAGTFTAVAAGWYHSLAIRSDGTLAGWGYNGNGQIAVPAGTFVAVAGGSSHSLAIRADGTLAGWGYNAYAQVNVPAGTFTAVAGGLFHSLAIRTDGTLAAWGYNGSGQIDVPKGTYIAIAAGRDHSLAIRSDGTLIGWGYNGSGQLNVPTGTYTAVAAGGSHSLGIRVTPIPTVSGWGLIAMMVLVLGAGACVLARRRAMTWSLGGPIYSPVVAAILVLLGNSRNVLAEPGPVPSQTVALNVDSGFVSASQGTGAIVLFSHLVQVQDAPWVRLYFGDVQLSGSPSGANESFVRITSQADGAVQDFDSSGVARWGNTSAYFNGEAIMIELFAYPGTGANRLLLESVVAGIPSELEDPGDICETDIRAPSSDPRAARIMPAGCTAFLFNQRPNCLLTAGHCVPVFTDEVVEFNVPESNSSNGSPNHPDPQDQYPVDSASIQFWDLGPWNDWCQFGVFNNTTTLLSPLRAQGASYNLADDVLENYGNTLRVTGYGRDFDPPKYNQTQQTDPGPYLDKVGTIVKYDVDAAVGTSGAAVEHEGSGLVYAIHTHQFCNETPQSIQGTAIDHSQLRNALRCPIGVCADCNGNGILDQCDLNCASTCAVCNLSECGGSSDCNSNSVPDECESPIGACCVGTTCTVVVAQICCTNLGGTFKGVNTDCQDCNGNGVPDACVEPMRACCHPESYDDCIVTTQVCCELDGGNFRPSCLQCDTCACDYLRPQP